MPSQELNLIFRLSGDAVNGLKRVNNDMQNLSKALNHVSQQASRVASSFMFLGGSVVGAFSLSLRTAADYSEKVKTQLDSMNNVLIRLQVQIAEAVLPTVEKFANMLASIAVEFNKLDPAVRNMVLNVTLLAGAWALFGGAILKTGALIVRVAAVIAGLNPVVIGIIAALAGLAAIMHKFGVSVQDVMNAIEIMVRVSVANFSMLYSHMAKGIAFIIGLLEKYISTIEFVWEKTSRMFGKTPNPESWGVVKGLRAARQSVDDFSSSLDQLSMENMQKVGRMMSGEDGIVVEDLNIPTSPLAVGVP